MRRLIIALGALATVAGSAPAIAQSIDQRAGYQDQRIREGERDGQLTPGEARRLHYRQMRQHRMEARMRWRSGGALTPRQRYRLRAMQQRDSAQIYQLKHNYRRY